SSATRCAPVSSHDIPPKQPVRRSNIPQPPGVALECKGVKSDRWQKMTIGINRVFIAFFVIAGSAAVAQEHTATNGTNPLAGSPAAVAAGERLYRQTCQACHGGQARGDRGPALATNNFAH